eukprot:1509314-Pyramimonas_sp.AAC.1
MQARPRHFFDDLVGPTRVPRTRVLRLPENGAWKWPCAGVAFGAGPLGLLDLWRRRDRSGLRALVWPPPRPPSQPRTVGHSCPGSPLRAA